MFSNMVQISQQKSNGFPAFLRHWRSRRRMSQLGLALSANLSQRHISFLETGRSNPSRFAISSLGQALEMPAAEVDAMMMSAGFVAGSPQGTWDTEMREAIDLSIDHVLRGHDPYPALAVDRMWTIQKANDAALAFFYRIGAQDDPNLLRCMVGPGPVRESIANWADCTQALMRLYELEIARRPHDVDAHALLQELLSFDGVDEAMCQPAHDTPVPLITIQFRVEGSVLSLFSLIATVGMNADARLDDIRIETLLPTDEMTRDWFTQL